MRSPVIALLALLSACLASPPDPPAPPLPPPVAGCTRACDRLRELGCPAGEPTPDGVPCENVCAELESLIDGGYQTGCVSSAPDCSQADDCGS